VYEVHGDMRSADVSHGNVILDAKGIGHVDDLSFETANFL